MNWIDNYVEGLIELYNTRDVYDLYDCLEIDIVKLDKNNILLLDSEAFYNRNYLGIETVFIRNNLSTRYERFILAHELGHAVIHTYMPYASFNRKLINKGKIEKQANYFALKLLNINLKDECYRNLTINQISSMLELPIKVINDFKI
ncbi:putative Zn peptidase [Gottschalkia purinilytica]|uniref:Putative Zn peptidase n=1 Tax=Gottschalkia purinilytica TaxID=1503 RepID=A0A0L0W642_GOTPU|nr:ImmA/IrrE family metallo-endopeptidase [Gottschalkia purinilytica]KNF06979.1 putative Zn peptidase [Gottschalkia purinilytica]